MPAKIKDQGDYDLFETNHGHRILVLNGKRYYAWIKGQQSPILVHTDSDHTKDHTIRSGEFYLVDFENDPRFKDMLHLFLQKGDEFQEYMLPDGLPTERDTQKRFVVTDETLPKEKLQEYLEHPAPAGQGESRMGRPGGGSMANVAHYLGGIDFPASRDQVIAYARKHDAPKAVVDQLQEMHAGQRLGSMADVMSAIGEGKDEEAH